MKVTRAELIKPGDLEPGLLYKPESRTAYKGVWPDFVFDPDRDHTQGTIHMFGQGTYVTFDPKEAYDFSYDEKEPGRVARFKLEDTARLFDYPRATNRLDYFLFSRILHGLYEESVCDLIDRGLDTSNLEQLEYCLKAIQGMVGQIINYANLIAPITIEYPYNDLLGSWRSRAIYAILLGKLGYHGIVYPLGAANAACIWSLSCMEFDGFLDEDDEL